MTDSATPPMIFAPARRHRARARGRLLQKQVTDARGPARYLLDDMVDDIIERLAFVRAQPSRVLVVGDWTGRIARSLARVAGDRGAIECEVEITCADLVPVSGESDLNEEQPWPMGGFDVIVSLGTLDTVNDLPGALLHAHRALAPGGIFLASMMGAGSLTLLRAIMFAADGARPAARMHPMVDARAGSQLMQRAGFVDAVADARGLDVRFGSLEALVGDLRAQACGSMLANKAPPLGKAGLARARDAFADVADNMGRVTEHFEILTLSGWRHG